MEFHELNPFIQSYVETALWSSYADMHPMDQNYSWKDFAPETKTTIIAECIAFIETNAVLLEGIDLKHAGHDFWLTRNHHGAGFWDGDYPEDLGDRLTKAAHQFKECDLYIGDDNKVYIL